MTLFLMIWLVFTAALGAMAVGTLWGRTPPQGSCARSAGCLFECPGCTRDPGERHNASRRAR